MYFTNHTKESKTTLYLTNHTKEVLLGNIPHLATPFIFAGYFFQISPEKIVREPREDAESDDEEENGIVVAQQEAVVAEEVPVEIEVEELVEREVMKDFMEERRIPQVKALYTYKGQGMKVEKGEVRFP